MARSPTLAELRRYAIARSLFKPVTLPAAIRRLGFVQADPMRAPARAQDLILFQRVRDYRAGDLERRYERLAIEEDAFVNYGFVPREMLALLHPRTPRQPWDEATVRRAREVLDFVRERGAVHPREVGEAFVHHGRVPGYWGGELNASTRLLEHMHHHGWLRVRRRESGTRVYEAMQHVPQDDSPAARLARAEALADQLLARWGVVFYDLVAHEHPALRWRDLQWALRRMEDRGQVSGGRFVRGFSGEQFALPQAAEALKAIRRSEPSGRTITLSGADPLNLTGVVLPGDRVPARSTERVELPI